MTDMKTPTLERTSNTVPAEPKSFGTSKGCTKIGIFGNFGGSNLGNEGSLEAMMTFLREVRPQAEIVCICTEPENVARTYSINAHPLRVPRVRNASYLRKLWTRMADIALTLRNVRGFDTLIIPGTGILDDFGEPPQGMPLTLFLVCLVARLRGIKIAFVSVGAGPINHPLSRRLMKYATAMAHYRSFRDEISKEFMESIGLDTSDDRVYPDIAFKLADTEITRNPDDGRLRVGVGVMSYYGWEADPERGANIYAAYIEKMTSFVRWLLARNHHVRILTGEGSDQRAQDDLLAAIGEREPALTTDQITSEPIGSLHDLMDQIARTDVVVATRFHNVVCALKTGRPTISLGYAKKNDVLLAEMGLARFCQHVEDLDVEQLNAQFEELIENREALAECICRVSHQYEKSLDKQNHAIAKQFL